MRIATLNLRHGGGQRVQKLIEFIASLDVDAIVLTEFRCGHSGNQIQSELLATGYKHQSSSSVERAKNCVLLASRIRMEVIDRAAGPAGHEHCLAPMAIGEIKIVGAYFPQLQAKRPVFEQALSLLPEMSPLGLLLGDLNTGLPVEDEEGDTFSCVDSFSSLLAAGFVDAWRLRHPAKKEYSWFSRLGNGFRIDHALCTPEFNRRVVSVEYIQSCRIAGITDHAALLLCIAN